MSFISVAKEPQTALHNAAHLYSNQTNPFIGIQRRLEPAREMTVVLCNSTMHIYIATKPTPFRDPAETTVLCRLVTLPCAIQAFAQLIKQIALYAGTWHHVDILSSVSWSRTSPPVSPRKARRMVDNPLNTFNAEATFIIGTKTQNFGKNFHWQLSKIPHVEELNT